MTYSKEDELQKLQEKYKDMIVFMKDGNRRYILRCDMRHKDEVRDASNKMMQLGFMPTQTRLLANSWNAEIFFEAKYSRDSFAYVPLAEGEEPDPNDK